MILKHSDNKFLLKPEILQKKNRFIYAVYPYKETLLKNMSSTDFNFNDLLHLSFDICQGLIYLHEKKYLHLDISPDNIYLNDDNSFCIGDYSSVRKSNAKGRYPNLYITPGYSPPEFTASHKNKVFINELSDEYSLAKTILSLFQMPQNSSENNTKIQEAFLQILNKACSEVQDFRYPSIIEFKNAISEFKKQNSRYVTDLKLSINISDDLFCNLKTQPINKLPANTCKKNCFSFLNAPVFMTIVIILSVLFPLMVLYKIFFLPHNSSIPPYETNKTANLSGTMPNDTVNTNNINIVSTTANTIKSSAPHTAAPIVSPLPTEKKIHFSTKSPNILYVNEFDVEQNIIKDLSADTLKKITGKELDNNSLKILSANNNSINDISHITSFKNIEELYISCNNIKNIDALASLKHLKTLVISSNAIEDIYMLSKIKTLENLDLSCNKKLKNITPLTKLKSLKLLCISETSISKNDILKLKKSLPYCKVVD